MGYADTDQSGSGLRQRLYCRSFIVGSTSDPNERIAYLVLDTQSGDTAVRYGILQGLEQLGEEYKVYTRHNGSAIAVTGTHSHSGPGAWLNYLLPQITSKGFDKGSYQAIVDGCVLSVKRAHTSIQKGYLSTGTAPVSDANANRSPYAYLANPPAERSRYQDDVDKTMTALTFKSVDGKPLGILSWFPVHGTSLYQNNTLITGDNKGVAAYLFEVNMRSQNPDFVAGFSQANVGDTTPNILGAYCEKTGLPCQFKDSTCDGRTEGCHGRGPLFQFIDQGTRSCFEIGKRQYQTAQSLFNANSLRRIEPSTISSFHVFADFSSYNFTSPFNSSRSLKTCSAALGYGFAGGTTDGPGKFDFRQGTNDTDPDSPALKNPLWRVARAFVHQPSKEQQECQSPKPILLDVGAAKQPYDWSPNIVDIQMLRIGHLVMIIAPGEATTMSGRRWREAIAKGASSILGVASPEVIIGGPANTYAHYIATEEEYGVQRYEGASTLYGPHTLAAYVNLTLAYLPYLGSKDKTAQLPSLPTGPQPSINVDRSLSFITGVVVDNAPFFKNFGDVVTGPDAAKTYPIGQIVSTTFVGANPRNNFHLESTFSAVEFFDMTQNTWGRVRDDRDWHLVYRWRRVSTILGTSEVTLEWEIEDGTPAGQYRFKYYGDSKSITGTITPFEGTGPVFKVG